MNSRAAASVTVKLRDANGAPIFTLEAAVPVVPLVTQSFRVESANEHVPYYLDISTFPRHEGEDEE